MELEAIRKYMQDHPEGMRIRMADGTKYDIPHRDWVSFGPPQKTITGKEIVKGTSFLIFEEAGVGVTSMKLLNAPLVVELLPLTKNGGASKGKRRKSA